MMRIFLVPLIAGLLYAQSSDRRTVISAGPGWVSRRDPKTGEPTPPPRLLTRNVVLDPRDRVSGTPAAGALVVECRPEGNWFLYSCNNNRPCEVPGVCDKSKVLPTVNFQVLNPPGKLQLIASALIHREPKEAATLGVRAGGNPSDAVLFLNAQGVHWGPALNRVLEGSYCLRLNPLPVPARAIPQVFSVAWDRETDSEGIGQASLVPGLYTLDKGTPGPSGACSVDPDETPAWVLVAAEARFSQLNAQWKENAPRLAELERSGLAPSVMATLRHAILAALADDVTPR